MSNRDLDRNVYHAKGSSRARDREHHARSTEDSSDEEEHDRRKHKHKRKHVKSRDRSRSREGDRRNIKSNVDAVNSKSKSLDESLSRDAGELVEDTRVREMSISPQRDEEEIAVPTPPPPPIISKISIGFNKPQPPPASIKMNLGGLKPQTLQKKSTIASIFNSSDDEEPEEMPAEARMKMRNIGRETPTSAGPNSFGKTKQGFCDSKKIFEKNLKEAMDKVSSQRPTPKFSNAIFKS